MLHTWSSSNEEIHRSGSYGAPARNRTLISGSGGLRHIHWTTGTSCTEMVQDTLYRIQIKSATKIRTPLMEINALRMQAKCKNIIWNRKRF